MSNITTVAQRQRFRRETLKGIATLTLFALVAMELISQSMLHQDEYCLISHGKYNGLIYKSNDNSSKGGGMTLANQCLVQSKWMRLAQHSVQLTSINNGQKIIDDWLWIDYHDRINVLVEAPKPTPSEGGGVSFLIIEQTKYALDSEMSLAVVGGIIEPTTQLDANGQKTQMVIAEAPLMAAKREVEEEMKVTCQTWIALGKFRTDVNRGMGWVNPFLARDCSYSSNKEITEDNANVIGGDDTETQNIITMSFGDVRQALMAGRFLEVQWSNTVALAMLRY